MKWGTKNCFSAIELELKFIFLRNMKNMWKFNVNEMHAYTWDIFWHYKRGRITEIIQKSCSLINCDYLSEF